MGQQADRMVDGVGIGPAGDQGMVNPSLSLACKSSSQPEELFEKPCPWAGCMQSSLLESSQGSAFESRQGRFAGNTCTIASAARNSQCRVAVNAMMTVIVSQLHLIAACSDKQSSPLKLHNSRSDHNCDKTAASKVNETLEGRRPVK